MTKKLYVGNIAYGVNEESLTQTFGQCGSVESVKIITDRSTGQSKGFGFVEMASEGEAQQAIEKLNGAEVDGRTLKVSQARAQEERSGGGNRQGGGGGYSRGGGNRY